jgi:hypothetical protein
MNSLVYFLALAYMEHLGMGIERGLLRSYKTRLGHALTIMTL